MADVMDSIMVDLSIVIREYNYIKIQYVHYLVNILLIIDFISPSYSSDAFIVF